MAFCLRDAEYEFTRQRRGRRPPSESLRGLVVMAYALNRTQLTPFAFSKKFIDGRFARSAGSGLVYRWLRGERVPRRELVASISRDVPGLLELYEHPVFDLLADKPLKRARVERLLSKWRNPHDFPHWRFADDAERYVAGRFVSVVVRSDSGSLVERGDLDGFAVILGLVRAAEAADSTQDHITHMRNLYRALPAVMRLPHFRPHQDLLRHCVECVHLRDDWSSCICRVRWSVIYAQASAAYHEPCRFRRILDARGGPVPEIEDPTWIAVQPPEEPLSANPLETEEWWKQKWWKVAAGESDRGDQPEAEG